MKNIYIHIPFCARSCAYCTFAKQVSVSETLHQQFIESLKNEFLERKKELSSGIETIYFGGGTPSMLSTKYLKDLFAFLKSEFDLSAIKEIHLESHPDTLDTKKIRNFESLGIASLSMGIQTFDKNYEKFLGRNLNYHDSSLKALQSFRAKKCVDMIFALPSQTLESLKEDLELLKNLDVDQISYYALDYKKGSRIEGEIGARLDSDKVLEFYNYLSDYLISIGYEHYETYTFVKKGAYPLHNTNFWHGDNYLGFGPSAVGLNAGYYRKNAISFEDYEKSIAEEKVIPQKELQELSLRRCLRFIKGYDLQKLNLSPKDLAQIISNAKTAASYFKVDKTKVSLSREAMMNYEEALEILLEDVD